MNDRRPMKMVQKISFLCCQFCPYKTRFTGNLAKHIRTHTGERPFECQFCGKRFASKSNYNTHVVIHSPSVGSSPLKFPFGGGRVGKTRQSSSSGRPNMSNSEIVRSVPMVKTLLSSNRSSSRSAVQKLSPIGSFLMPNLTNSSFSHASLYSSFNLSGFETSSRTECFVDGSATSSFDNDPLDPPNAECGDTEDRAPVPEAIEATDRDCEDDRSSIEDVKPTIFDILGILPCEDKTALTKQMHNSQLIASIKQEAVDGVLRAENSYFARPIRRARRVKPGLRYFDGSDDRFNGHCSGHDSSSLSNDDSSRLHTQLLVDTLIKESRLFRCDSCNILFPEYSMYVLHLGCHGNGGAYQCHFCREFFEDRFGFTTHFVRCPHEPSSDCR